jgi:hypothetical protein
VSALQDRVKRFSLTAEQETARHKMLASPCPYCADPNHYQRELTGKPTPEKLGNGIARVGKFWARDKEAGMLQAVSRDYGDHWRIHIGGKHFIERFKDFSLDIISFESTAGAWHSASHAMLFRLSAAPPDIARYQKFSFNLARLTHKKSSIVVDAHTWFSHGSVFTVHHVPQEILSGDVTVMREALEFFRPETRGTPKFTEVDLVKSMQKVGKDATLTAVAKELNVTRQTLQFWARRGGMESWDKVKERYSNAELL